MTAHDPIAALRMGGHAAIVTGGTCGVKSETGIEACAAATTEAFGGISTLVNNVGCGAVNPDPPAVTAAEMAAACRLNTISNIATWRQRLVRASFVAALVAMLSVSGPAAARN